MSLQSWRKKFYPKPANKTTKREALVHSLTKWIGLRRHNLEEHNVGIDNHNIVSGSRHLSIDGSTCALCLHYEDRDKDTSMEKCRKCPLSISRGGTPCTTALYEEDRSPWSEWVYNNNPEPMIKALEGAFSV